MPQIENQTELFGLVNKKIQRHNFNHLLVFLDWFSVIFLDQFGSKHP